MSLAEKLDKIMYEYDPFSYRDSELSLEYFEKSIKETPEMVIDGLLDIMKCLMEECDNYAEQLQEEEYYG